MPKYQCIRDCFVSDRFHYEGRVYEMPDITKSPRNFRLVEEVVEPSSMLETVMAPPVKEYKCPECGKVVRTAFGLSGHSRSHKRKVTDGSTNT